MTNEEYVEMCAEKARKEARETISKYLQPYDNVKKQFVARNMTRKEFQEVVNKMETPVPYNNTPDKELLQFNWSVLKYYDCEGILMSKNGEWWAFKNYGIRPEPNEQNELGWNVSSATPLSRNDYPNNFDKEWNKSVFYHKQK